jgi:predicted NACHT family NTPase
VAKVSFEENRYFFKQEEIEKYIADYLRTLPHAQIDSLQRDSRAILKSIEVQHGLLMERAPEIYSFSHLTFQEYFTAKWFCDQDWKSLVKYVTELRWREIFLLAVQILQPPDELLQVMKQQIDLFLLRHEKKNEFQDFLDQVKDKALLIKTSDEIIITWFGNFFKIPYKLSSVCAFYLAIDPNIGRSLDLYYELVGFRSASGKALRFPLDDQLNLDLYLTKAYQAAYNNFGIDINDSLIRVHTLVSTLDPELDQSLYNLERQFKDREYFFKENKEELPKELTPKEALKFFWFAWAEHLRTLVFKHRRICQDWRFSDQQKKLLQQYYDANKLLIDSLNSSHVVSNEVREEIEKNLLLPFDVIENSQQQM